MISNRHYQSEITTIAGTSSVTIFGTGSDLRQIIVKAATPTTTFDVSLVDIYDLEVYSREDVTGELNDLPNIPAYGNYTFTISNASTDEEFIYLFVFNEQT